MTERLTMVKQIISAVFLNGGKAVSSLADCSEYAGGDAVALAQHYSDLGADTLLIFDQSQTDEEHDISLTLMRRMARVTDIPMWGAGNVRRVEDVKKILYAGCAKAVLNAAKQSNMDMLQEVSSRFGKEKIAVCIAPGRDSELSEEQMSRIAKYSDCVLLLSDDDCEADLRSIRQKLTDAAGSDGLEGPVPEIVLWLTGGCPDTKAAAGLLTDDLVLGLGCGMTQDPDTDLMGLKADLKEMGADVNTYTCSVSWDDLKKDGSGLVPVVVQDYRSEEVLMVAYMNREAFENTVRTGRMTYWSRSRSELWLKGLTSGHFQYLKELRIDCDNDTLLARISQIGAACHTGNRSCFYRSVLKKDTPHRNPMKVFEDVYATIEDRKAHPKEGSYTNYLFEKGIDKILKKCGEEATEIVIAAKNPNPEEIKYEVADFLYHMMVLMSAREITWDDIAQELANRE